MYGDKGTISDGEDLIPLGKADIKRAGSDLTIVAWSKMVGVAQKAATILEKDGYQAEIVDPRTLRPLDIETILQSVRKTNRLVVVEEGWPTSGFGAEIAYQVQRLAFDSLDAPVERVTQADAPLPYAGSLEKLSLPNPERVVEAAHKVLYT